MELQNKDQAVYVAVHFLNNVYSESEEAMAGIAYWNAHYKETGNADELVNALEHTKDLINQLIKKMK